MNKTMQELADSLESEPTKCIYCGKVQPDIVPINGPDAWTIIPDSILGFAAVCNECQEV